MLFDKFIAVFEGFKKEEPMYIKYVNDITDKAISKRRGQGHTLVKTSESIYVKYDSYKEQEIIQDRIAKGELTPTGKLEWGEWDTTYKNIKNHKGKKYARVYLMDDKKELGKVSACDSYFELDGKRIAYNDLLKCDFINLGFFNKKNDEPRVCFDLDIEKIAEIC